jgi:GNAT superfamily N-acetyltransferase
MFCVRDAVLSDVDTICDFNQRLAQETESRLIPPEVLRGGVLAALTIPDRLHYWVAVSSDEAAQVIGQVAVSYEWSDWRNGWIWWLQSVYVDSDWRGQGVFRALLDQIRMDATAHANVIGLRLYVEHENAPARVTYEKLGFVPAGYEVMEAMWADTTTRSSN